MALCTVHYRSESIVKRDTMSVVVPDGERPFPVLYLLHGLSGDHTLFVRLYAVERFARDQRLMLVMPDTGRFFYVNDPRLGGLAYEDHIVKDVIGFVERVFPAIPERKARAVAGISMGGYGALMLALRHRDLFSAAASISGAVLFAHAPIEGRLNVGPLSEAMPKDDYNLWRLAERYAATKQDLALRISCGTDDNLYALNGQLHTHLETLGVQHTYVEHPGAHDTDAFASQIPAVIHFAVEHLAQE